MISCRKLLKGLDLKGVRIVQFDSRRIIALIVAQRDLAMRLLHVHGREACFTPRLIKLSRPGGEARIVQLALVDDCLHAIESIVFSLNDSRNVDLVAIHKFLQPVSRLFAMNKCELIFLLHQTSSW